MNRICPFLVLVLALSALVASASAATITVTNTNDTGAGSLRAAVAAAVSGDAIIFSNTTAGGATNFYDGASHTITLTSALPTVGLDLTITGPSPTGLAVMRSAAANTPAFRIFTISNGTANGPTVTISGLSISNGTVNGGNIATGAGGGIYNDRATLTLRNVEVTGNSAINGGGLAHNGLGGNGSVTIDGCAFIGNSAGATGGGAMNFGGTMGSLNSTFANCSADQGGAIFSGNFGNPAASALTLANSTFKDNSANLGSAIFNSLNGGMNATTQIINTLFERDPFTSTTLANSGGSVTSFGYNLSSDNGGGFLAAGTDQINTDPKLGTLTTAPSSARFYPPAPGSPAIDKGRDFIGSGKDQRGLPRPYDYSSLANAFGGDGSDIGAIEVQTPAGQQGGSTLTITTAADFDDGVCSPSNCTLREAIAAAYYTNVANNNAGATIVFSASNAGGATNFYDGFPRAITLSTALPFMDSNIGLNGPLASLLSVQRSSAAGTPDFRIFTISSGYGTGPTVTISGLTIANGRGDGGGGIYNDRGNLTLASMVVANNEGGAAGGGVYNRGGRPHLQESAAILTIINTQFLGNSADTGGAISNSAPDDFNSAASANVSVSTFISNLARGSGGALASTGIGSYNGNDNPVAINTCTFGGNTAFSGGALFLLHGSMSVTNSRLTGNSAADRGGAIYSVGAPNLALLSVSSSTLDSNSAQLGGGICNEGDPTYNNGASRTTITNSTLSGNSAQYGGGICNLGRYANIDDFPTVGARANISSSTFSGNSASGSGSAIYNWGRDYQDISFDDPNEVGGAGVFLNNTIIERGNGSGTTLVSIFSNTSPGNGTPNGSIFSQGYNLSSDNGGGFLTATADQTNTNPQLGQLASNGGPTPTHALFSDSPAIDKGKDSTATHTDQRGMARPSDFGGVPNAPGGDGSDIGAYEVSPSPLQVSSAVSRKTHQVGGSLDVSLPLTGPAGVECRSPIGGNHTIVVALSDNVVSGNVSVIQGTATVGAPSFGDNLITVSLGGVSDAQTVILKYSNVTDSLGQVLPDVILPVGFLLGDVNGNGAVNASDIGQTKAQSGAPVNSASFRADVNTDGAINASDIGLVKSRSGRILP